MNHSTRQSGAALALLAAFALSACGGGGSVSPTSQAAAKTTQTVAVTVKVYIPATTTTSASTSRRPAYVSPGTNGALLTITQSVGGALVATSVTDLSSGSANCTGNAPRVCTIPIQAPPGSLVFALQTYDEAPVAGAIPVGAHELALSTVTQTIVADVANTVNFVLSGIVVGTTVNGTTAAYASLPANGSAQSYAVAVAATDASGNIITGSAPYATPISVSLAETNGSHSSLVINGTNVGASGSLTKATDTLAIAYDGLGSAGYTTVTTIAGSTLRLSPFYTTPASTTITKLSDTRSGIALTEASAPGSIAYSANATACSEVSGATITGSGAAATLGFNVTTPPGTFTTCSISLTDILGSTDTYAVTFDVPGPILGGAITFPSGGSGSCGTTLAFNAAGQTATFALTDTGYAGAFTIANPTPGVATASVTGANVTITAIAAGTTTPVFSDTAGNTFSCPVGVTTSGGSIQ